MISVIMTTYNREYTIRRAIDSILKQTYNDLELIIVDDGSSDDTEKKVNEIKDERIRYIKLQKNVGRSRALNIGLREARGEFITFHDSDDICYVDRLEKQYRYLNEHDADAVFCQMNRYMEDDKSFISTFPNNISEAGKVQQVQIVSGSKISPQCLMIKKEVINNCLFDERLKRLVDWDFSINMSQYYKLHFMKEILCDVYLQNDSITLSDKNEDNRIAALLTILIDKYDNIWEKYPNEYLRNLYNLRRYLVKRDNISKVSVEKKICKCKGGIIQRVYLLMTYLHATKLYYLIRKEKE